MERKKAGQTSTPQRWGAPTSRTDKAITVLTGVTVAGLASVAGAISFSHMTELATEHGQTGWHSWAFPISVDGLEVVASLVLVTQRRVGRRPGWLPWLALGVGTAASLAANVAVGGQDVIGRLLAGWPAVSLLVSVKLLFSMFDHVNEGQLTAPDHHRPSANEVAVRAPVRSRRLPGRPARRTADQTAAAVARVRVDRPDARVPDIAAAVGVSERHVRRLVAAAT